MSFKRSASGSKDKDPKEKEPRKPKIGRLFSKLTGDKRDKKTSTSGDKKEEIAQAKKHKSDKKRDKKEEKSKDKEKTKSKSSRKDKEKSSKKKEGPPMPSSEEINQRLGELLDEMEVSSEQRAGMEKMSDENKWIFILNKPTITKKSKRSHTREKKDSPAYFITELRERPSIDSIKSLRIALGTQPVLWANTFREKGGIVLIIDCLHKSEKVKHKSNNDTEMIMECLKCLKTVMNNKAGLAEVVTTKESINKIALCLDTPEITIKLIVYELLAATVLLHDDGHTKTIEAIDYYKYRKRETRRFYHLISTLKHEKDNSVRSTCISFINVLINTPEKVEDRIELRNEFLNLGLSDLLNTVKSETEDAGVLAQIQNFQEDAVQDEDEEKEKYVTLKNIDFKSPKDVCLHLANHIKHSDYLRGPLLDVLKSLLLFPLDKDGGLKMWLVTSKVVNQLARKKDEIRFENEASIDVEELMMSIEDKQELEALKEKQFIKQQKLEEEAEKYKRRLKREKKERAEYEKKKWKPKLRLPKPIPKKP